MADDIGGGIALGLSLDTSGFSTGIQRAESQLERLRRSAAKIEIGVSVPGLTAPRGGGIAARAASPYATGAGNELSPSVSPRFNVSAGSVRQLRTQINAAFRELQAGGEAVAVPVKLGRVQGAQFRQQI